MISKVILAAMMATPLIAQVAPAPAPTSTSTDIYVMAGSDTPTLRANLNIGIGHTFAALHSMPTGDELTASYTYEDSSSHGFWHGSHSANTISLGEMKNIAFGHSAWGLYLWQQAGVTNSLGTHLYLGESIGLTYRMSRSSSLWLQESLNNVWSQPYYTSTNFGYTYSF